MADSPISSAQAKKLIELLDRLNRNMEAKEGEARGGGGGGTGVGGPRGEAADGKIFGDTRVVNQLASIWSEESLTRMQKYHRSFQTITATVGNLASNVNRLTSLVGAQNIGFGAGIATLDKYNRTLISTGVQFQKYGVGITQVETKLRSLTAVTGGTMQETMELARVYEQGFRTASLDNMEKVFRNIREVTGGNIEAAREYLQVIQQTAEKFPGLENALVRRNAQDREVAKNQITILLAAGKISLAESKRLREYLDGTSKTKRADDEKRKQIEAQIQALNQMRQAVEQINLVVGTELMRIIKPISSFISEYNGLLKTTAAALTYVVLGVKAVGVAGQSWSFFNSLTRWRDTMRGGPMTSALPGAAGGAGAGTGGAAGVAAGGLSRGALAARGAMGGLVGGYAGSKLFDAGYSKMVGGDVRNMSGSAQAGKELSGAIGGAVAGAIVGGPIGAGVGAIVGLLATQVEIIRGVFSFMQDNLTKAAEGFDPTGKQRAGDLEVQRLVGERAKAEASGAGVATLKAYDDQIAATKAATKANVEMATIEKKMATDMANRPWYSKAAEAIRQDRAQSLDPRDIDLDAGVSMKSVGNVTDYARRAAMYGGGRLVLGGGSEEDPIIAKANAEKKAIAVRLASAQTAKSDAEKRTLSYNDAIDAAKQAAADAAQRAVAAATARNAAQANIDSGRSASNAAIADRVSYDNQERMNQLAPGRLAGLNSQIERERLGNTAAGAVVSLQQNARLGDLSKIVPEVLKQSQISASVENLAKIGAFVNALDNKAEELTKRANELDAAGGDDNKAEARRLRGDVTVVNRQRGVVGGLQESLQSKREGVMGGYNAAADATLAQVDRQRMSYESANEAVQAQAGYFDKVLEVAQATGKVTGEIDAAYRKNVEAIRDQAAQANTLLQTQEQAAALAREAEAAQIADLERQRAGATTDDQRLRIDMQIAQAKQDAQDNERNRIVAINQQRVIAVSKEKELLDAAIKRSHTYDGMLRTADMEASLLEQQVAMADNMAMGVRASAEARYKVVDAIQKSINLEQQNLAKVDEDIANATDEKAIESLRQRRLEIETSILGKQQKQLEVTKAMRDGYVSAIAAMTTGAGVFSKIVTEQDKNFGGFVANAKGAVQSYTTGGVGMGGQVAGRGGSARYVANGAGNLMLSGGSTDEASMRVYNAGGSLGAKVAEWQRKYREAAQRGDQRGMSAASAALAGLSGQRDMSAAGMVPGTAGAYTGATPTGASGITTPNPTTRSSGSVSAVVGGATGSASAGDPIAGLVSITKAILDTINAATSSRSDPNVNVSVKVDGVDRLAERLGAAVARKVREQGGDIASETALVEAIMGAMMGEGNGTRNRQPSPVKA